VFADLGKGGGHDLQAVEEALRSALLRAAALSQLLP